MADQPRKGRERHCWVCGESMGWIEDRHFVVGEDTCGKSDCEREARHQAEYERQQAHEDLDRDRGWS